MNLLEIKIAINQIAFVVFGITIAVAFTVGSFKTGQWLWLVAVPMNILGIAMVIIGGLRRRQTDNERGMALSVCGSVFIVGSIWAAFLLGNRFPA